MLRSGSDIVFCLLFNFTQAVSSQFCCTSLYFCQVHPFIGGLRCDGRGTILPSLDCDRQWYTSVLLCGTSTVPFWLGRHLVSRQLEKIEQFCFLPCWITVIQVRETCTGTRGTQPYIFILLTVWYGEPSAESEKLGETW